MVGKTNSPRLSKQPRAENHRRLVSAGTARAAASAAVVATEAWQAKLRQAALWQLWQTKLWHAELRKAQLRHAPALLFAAARASNAAARLRSTG